MDFMDSVDSRIIWIPWSPWNPAATLAVAEEAVKLSKGEACTMTILLSLDSVNPFEHGFM